MAKRFLIGIDLGGTNLRIGLLDLKYRVIDRESLSTKSFEAKDRLIAAIAGLVDEVLKRNHLNKSSILAVGLGLPGPIDIKRGIVRFFPNIPGWKKVNLKDILEKKTGLRIFLDNDVNLVCLAEHTFGAARGLRNVVCVTLGTGVGGGLILEGKLYRGSSFSAGEIGHIPINENGPLCNCGGRACLEAYIGNKKILREAAKLFKRPVSLEELSGLAKQDNKTAVGIWARAGERLGIALSGVVNLINPDAIVIGGGVANAGKVLFDRVRQAIRNRAMAPQAGSVRVLKSKLGNDAGLIGAAILAREGA